MNDRQTLAATISGADAPGITIQLMDAVAAGE